MDGTITINGTENENNQQLHVANVAGGLEDDHHHHTIDEEQIMHLTDITDLTQDDIVSIPKEIILISLVSQEQALYNPKHENYRNTQRKDVKWMEIAEHVGWSETQCKAKWKAMRDQYCRELKRSKFNIKANVKWKYFKELDFLRPYALARNYRPRNPSTTSQLNANGAIFTCPPTTTSLTSSITVSETNNAKYTTIKLENNPQSAFDACDFVNNKTDTSTTLTEDQLNSVLQQQQQHHHHHQQHQPDDNNWSYLTGSTTNSSNNNPTRLDNHSLTDGHLLSNHTQQQTTDEALYNALVDCVGQIQQQQQQQQHQHLCEPTTSSVSSQQPTTSTQSPPDEEDDDPIHTFLNIESYFEKELILLIQHEDVLYNSYHPNYRNVKLKMEVWDEIARKLKKTVKQCRLKWKALRDQFIREHKRLKHRDNVETLPRWKHYDALSFLQKFIKHKTRDYELTKSSLLQITKTEMDTADMDDDDDQIHMSVSSPLRSPLENIKCEIHQDPTQPITTRSVAQQQHLQQLTTLTTCHQQHHHNQHSNNSDNLCVSAGSVEGYDDMDIDNYIIGDGGSVVEDSQSGKTEDHQPDSMDEHKSQHDFDVHLYNNGHATINHNNNNNNLNEFHHQQHLNQHTVGGLENKITSQASPERLQQQQHITITNLNLNSNNTLTANSVPPSTLINHNDMHTIANSNNDTKAIITTTFNSKEDLLMATTTTETAVSSISCLQIKSNIHTPSAPSRNTVEAFTNTTPLASPIQPQRQQQQLQHPQQQQQNILSTNMNTCSRALTEDDEVGAFFKAIAMKIRNAEMSPVAFTDLQIDILRVINCSLRNH